jgi:hypothetical protein
MPLTVWSRVTTGEASAASALCAYANTNSIEATAKPMASRQPWCLVAGWVVRWLVFRFRDCIDPSSSLGRVVGAAQGSPRRLGT